MAISSALRELNVSLVEDTFQQLTSASLQRGINTEPPLELFDLFQRYPIINDISDNVRIYGTAMNFPDDEAIFLSNGGRMPLAALASYDEAHSLGLFSKFESSKIPETLVSVVNKGASEIERVSAVYPVINKLIDLTLLDVMKLRAPSRLVALIGRGAAHSLCMLVGLVENAETSTDLTD